MRVDGRSVSALRQIKVVPQFQRHPAGSCLVEFGNTRVACSVMMEDGVPSFLKGSGKGWLTAEYSMLPGCSSQRVGRERAKVGGRTHEIQRLIGRSLRSAIDLNVIGERTLLIDCDVLDADGGTRTAAITGSFIALGLALRELQKKYPAFGKALTCAVAAVSVGMVNGEAVLDLNYSEDKVAEVDMNVVKTSRNQFVEVQGTAEGKTFDETALQQMLALASLGIQELFAIQKKVLEG